MALEPGRRLVAFEPLPQVNTLDETS